jgi:hypothetical protein
MPEPEPTRSKPVAEIVTFRLRPGTDAAAFVELARATNKDVAAQPGFLRRSLSCDPSGLWTEHIEWADLERAQAAARTVMALPSFKPFGAAIDGEGLVLRHAEILLTMGD